jgi:hypothetical protein
MLYFTVKEAAEKWGLGTQCETRDCRKTITGLAQAICGY